MAMATRNTRTSLQPISFPAAITGSSQNLSLTSLLPLHPTDLTQSPRRQQYWMESNFPIASIPVLRSS